VDGLVERPLVLSAGELLARALATVVADFHCVTGWSVPAVRWQGVPVSDLLLVVAFSYGYEGVKWVRRVTAVAAAGAGCWEARGYDSDARIRD
jgi:DMSO/TMAO reductase YedYZ molybdopterin-dependent catalytic subunit